MQQIHGKVWWSELMTRDVPGVRDFYENVCGWRVETMQMPEGLYSVCICDGKPVAGIMDMLPLTHLDGVKAHWVTYLAVADIDAAMAATEAAGGVVQRAPYEVPTVGHIAMVSDPGGALVGLVMPVAED